MMTVTNAFSPHLLPFPVRQDLNGNQPQALKPLNAHALGSGTAVVPTPQKYFGANFSAHLSHPNPVARQLKLPSNMAAFHVSAPASRDVTSVVVHPNRPLDLLRFQAPCADHLAFLPQRLDSIDTSSLPRHFDIPTSSHLNLMGYPDVQLGVSAGMSQTKATGNTFQTVTPPSNTAKDAHYPEVFPVPLSFIHPHLSVIQKHQLLSQSNAVTGKTKSLDIDTASNFKESKIAQTWTHPKVCDMDSITRCELSPRLTMASEKSKKSSSDLKSPLSSPLSSSSSSSLSPSPPPPPSSSSSSSSPSSSSLLSSSSSSSSSLSPSSSSSSLPSSSPSQELKAAETTHRSPTSSNLFTQKSLSPNHSPNAPERCVVSKVEMPSETGGPVQEGFPSDKEITGNNNVLNCVEKRDLHDDVIGLVTMKDGQRREGGDTDDRSNHADEDVKMEIESPEDDVIVTGGSCAEALNKPTATSLRHSIESILRTSEKSHKSKAGPDFVNTDDKHCGFVERMVDSDEGEVNLIDDDLDRDVCDVEDNQDSISIISDETEDDDVEVEIYDENGCKDVCQKETLHPTSMTSDSDHKINHHHSSLNKKHSPSHKDGRGPESPEIINKHQAEAKDQIKMKMDGLTLENSPLYISEHLKRLEGLITKENALHFQKDEFYQARLQILHSVSKNCKLLTNTQQMQQQRLGSEGGLHGKLTEANSCTVSNLPPFQSLLPSGDPTAFHQNAPFCPRHQTAGHLLPQHPYCRQIGPKETNHLTHGVGQKRGESLRLASAPGKEESQKSAFRPILRKHHHPLRIRSAHSQGQGQTGSAIDQALPPRAIASQPAPIGTTAPLSVDPSEERLGNGDSSSGTPEDSNISNTFEDPINLDAISLLRFRSNTYQSPGSLPSSFTYSSSARPNPEAVNAWLSWLRSRNSAEIGNGHHLQPIPAALSKVPPPPRYHCGDCNKTYSTFGGLSKHRQFHCALHVKKEFACKICTKSYSSLGALKMHIRTHTLPCKCHICGKAFSRPWLLQGHVRTHTGEKPFRCNHCGRAFADRSNLRAHLQTHAEIKKYACVKCGKTFSRMSLLTKHSDGSCPANVSSCL